MLQYVSGGKWGLLLRRPLEAMTRTLPLVALMLVPMLVLREAPVSVGCAFPTDCDRACRCTPSGRR